MVKVGDIVKNGYNGGYHVKIDKVVPKHWGDVYVEGMIIDKNLTNHRIGFFIKGEGHSQRSLGDF